MVGPLHELLHEKDPTLQPKRGLRILSSRPPRQAGNPFKSVSRHRLSLAANVQLQDEHLALVILARQPLVRQAQILHHHLTWHPGHAFLSAILATCGADPSTCKLDPATCKLDLPSFDVHPMTCDVHPVTCDVHPVTCDVLFCFKTGGCEVHLARKPVFSP